MSRNSDNKDNDGTDRTSRLAIIEDHLGKQHAKVGTLSMQMVELVGMSGQAGVVGQMKQDIKEVEGTVTTHGQQIDRLNQFQWKVMAVASGGAIVGSIAFGLIKWLLERAQ